MYHTSGLFCVCGSNSVTKKLLALCALRFIHSKIDLEQNWCFSVFCHQSKMSNKTFRSLKHFNIQSFSIGWHGSDWHNPKSVLSQYRVHMSAHKRLHKILHWSYLCFSNVNRIQVMNVLNLKFSSLHDQWLTVLCKNSKYKYMYCMR